MKEFVYSALSSRVVFGAGKLASIRDEVEAIGASRALVLCTPQQRAQATEVADLLGSRLAGIHDGAQMHVPIESARKRRSVIYDPDLTMTLPVGMSLVSGMNAIAHAAEGLYARDGNPVMSLMAQEGISALAEAMPVLVSSPEDKEARAKCIYGAWLCGTVLGNVGMALHHKLCHTLGGSFNLPHAETHTVVLPHAMAYNSPVTPEAMEAHFCGDRGSGCSGGSPSSGSQAGHADRIAGSGHEGNRP